MTEAEAAEWGEKNDCKIEKIPASGEEREVCYGPNGYGGLGTPAPGMESPFERRTLDEIFPGKEIFVTDRTGKVLRVLPGSICTEPGKTVREVIEALLGPDEYFNFREKRSRGGGESN